MTKAIALHAGMVVVGLIFYSIAFNLFSEHMDPFIRQIGSIFAGLLGIYYTTTSLLRLRNEG